MKRLFAAALLALSSIAFGATLMPIQLLNPAGSTAGQAIVSTGATTAPAWSNVTATALVPQAANTVVANATGSTASPTAVSVPNCLGTSSALNYTAGSGFGCNSTVNAVTLGGATFASPGPIGSVSTSSGAFSSVSTPSATIGGGTIDNTAIGNSSASTGKFTTLSANSTVSGTGFSTYLAAPPAIGGTTPAAGTFTNVGVTGNLFKGTAGWTTYSPTLTAAAGTYTSATATGKYRDIGGVVFVDITVTITTVGTGTYPIVSMPSTILSGGSPTLAGRETGSTGKAVLGTAITTTTIELFFYDNSVPAANGYVIHVTGFYINS
jgi:hypothetical protein